MDLSERIIAYIENHHPISYSKLVQVAAGKGFDEFEVTQALAIVHQNKSIATKNRKNEIWYDLVTIKPDTAPTHTSWLRDNYPWPGLRDMPPFEMPFPEIDYSFIFMTRDEAKEYKAAAKGMPVHMIQSRYGNNTRK